MMNTRKYSISDVTPEELGQKLSSMSWCLCSGFRCLGLLWLNDSSCVNSLQEFAVVREHDMFQIESVTVSWCGAEKIQEYAETLLPECESIPPFFGPVDNPDTVLEHPETCHYCA